MLIEDPGALGKRIKYLREEFGLSQEGLARAAGQEMSQTTISRIERGATGLPNVYDVTRIARALDRLSRAAGRGPITVESLAAGESGDSVASPPNPVVVPLRRPEAKVADLEEKFVTRDEAAALEKRLDQVRLDVDDILQGIVAMSKRTQAALSRDGRDQRAIRKRSGK